MMTDISFTLASSCSLRPAAVPGPVRHRAPAPSAPVHPCHCRASPERRARADKLLSSDEYMVAPARRGGPPCLPRSRVSPRTASRRGTPRTFCKSAAVSVSPCAEARPLTIAKGLRGDLQVEGDVARGRSTWPTRILENSALVFAGYGVTAPVQCDTPVLDVKGKTSSSSSRSAVPGGGLGEA